MMARPAGLEPATLGLEGRCSIQMSYRRLFLRCALVGVEGFEPPTSCSQSRRATRLRYTPMTDFEQGCNNTERNDCRQSFIRLKPHRQKNTLVT